MEQITSQAGPVVTVGGSRSSGLPTVASEFPSCTQYHFAAAALRNHAAELSEGEWVASRTYVDALLTVAKHIEEMAA